MLANSQSPPYHELSPQEVIKVCDSHLETGLTPEAVARRGERYGWHQLPVHPGKPTWLRFLLQFHQNSWV